MEPRRLAVVPEPADDAVVRPPDHGAELGRARPASTAHAVVEELVEAAITIGEDVEEIVEGVVGEVLACGSRSLGVVWAAARHVEEGRPLTAAGEVVTALRREAVPHRGRDRHDLRDGRSTRRRTSRRGRATGGHNDPE